MSRALDVSLALPTQDLAAYKHAVHQFPLLELHEERDLAERFRDKEDLDAAWHLVTSHLRFVVKIARGYAGYGLGEADLVQEGNVGLMKAVKRFDPNFGVRLASFAAHWIKAEIHEFILRNWRIVKVATTKAQRKLFFNLRGKKKDLGWLNAKQTDQIAAELDVRTRDVAEMEKRLFGRDEAFDLPNDDAEVYAPAVYIEDERYEPSQAVEQAEWDQHTACLIEHGMAALDERSRDIVKRRWVLEPKATLHELADEYSVSAERIRQIEAAALKRLRAQFVT
jgi:RNA polymerase sigma-32 factor